MLLLLLPFQTQGQFYFTPKLATAHSLLLKLQLDAGKKLLHESKDNAVPNGIPLYLANYADVLSLLISQDKDLYQQLRGNEASRLQQLQKYSPDSPYYLFTQAEIKLQWATVKLLFNEEFSAAWQIRQAYKLLEENEALYPDFLPQQKTLGAIQILIGTMPDKYRWVMDLLGLKGNLQEGIQRMRRVEQLNSPYTLETKLLRQVINLYVLNQEKEAVQQFRSLHQAERDHLLIHLLYAIALYKTNKGKELTEILANIPADVSYHPVPYLWLLKGDAMLHQGSYVLAKTYYQSFLKQHKGENFIKNTYYKLFLACWLHGQEQEANMYRQAAIEKGNTATEMDRYALSFVSSPSLPHPLLTKARLYADGGYYSEALGLLNNINPSHLAATMDKAEYFYRKARVLHQQQNYEAAIPLYQKTIDIAGTYPSYLAPNAALQLGYIYKEKKQAKLAARYLKQAMSYKGHEYKSSIDSKAKAALATLINNE